MPIPIVQSQSQFENVRNGHTHTAIRRLFAPKSTRPRIQRDTHSAMAATHSSVSSERRGTHSSDVFTPSVRRSGRGGVVDIGQSTRTTVTRRCGTHSSASFMRPSGVRHLGAMREDGSAPLTWVLMGHGHPRISLCHPLCGMACGFHGGAPPTLRSTRRTVRHSLLRLMIPQVHPTTIMAGHPLLKLVIPAQVHPTVLTEMLHISWPWEYSGSWTRGVSIICKSPPTHSSMYAADSYIF